MLACTVQKCPIACVYIAMPVHCHAYMHTHDIGVGTGVAGPFWPDHFFREKHNFIAAKKQVANKQKW